MPAKRKLVLGYCPEGSFGGSGDPFDKLFSEVRDVKRLGLDGIDCLVLWGGADIHPDLYRERKSEKCYAGTAPSKRDIFEWNCLKWCKIHDIPTIGVCRGAQMQCAFAGGTLAQHVANHGTNHLIETKDGQKMLATSVHHQMMNPYTNKVPHELIAWTFPSRSDVYYGGNDEQIDIMKISQEPEIVWFPEIRGLAIQGHPEYKAHGTDAFRELCVTLASEFCLNEKVEA